MEGSGEAFVSVAAVDAFEVNFPLAWRRFSLSHDGYPHSPLYRGAQIDLSLEVASGRPRTCDQLNKGNGY
jgi:hypothetical protein